MNRMGALITLALVMGITFIAWKALGERFDVQNKIVKRFSLLRRKPWTVVLAMFGVIVVLGFAFMILRLPEVSYYIAAGIIITSTLTLLNAANSYVEEEPIVKPEKPDSPEGEKTSEDTSDENTESPADVAVSAEKAEEETPAENADEAAPEAQAESTEANAPAEDSNGPEAAPEESTSEGKAEEKDEQPES